MDPHCLFHALQWDICSGAWSTFSPSFFTDLGVHRAVCLTSAHSTIHWLGELLCNNFFHLFYPRGSATMFDGLALATASPLWRPVTGSTRHGGSFQKLPRESKPIAPPLSYLGMLSHTLLCTSEITSQ